MSGQGPATIAACLAARARQQPHAPALIVPEGTNRYGRPRYTHYTYKELDDESSLLAAGLLDLGLGSGVRTVLLVRPGLDLFALAFALFKIGAVIVAVDPGMGRRNLARCLDEAEPAAFLGVPEAHWGRRLLGWGRRSIRIKVVVGPRSLTSWGTITLEGVRRRGTRGRPPNPEDVPPDATASVAFTSGSTGCPKGVIYSHGMLTAQARALAELFAIQPGEMDLATFVHFAFFAPALGITTVLADMDFSRPATVDPHKIVSAVEHFGVTNMFASPAVLDRVSRWGEQAELRLRSLRRVVSAGAPVSPAVLERTTRMLHADAQIFTPYGATEALPITCIGSRELLGETRSLTEAGRGVCVGLPVRGVEVRIIRIIDEPVAAWSDELLVGPGEVGEIVVQGPVVSAAYLGRPDANALAKISGAKGLVHRTGDLGYWDEKGRLWFCGRKSQRVKTPSGDLFTVPCEGIFNTHPRVGRTALVGVVRKGVTRPVLCVEPAAPLTAAEQEQVRRELLALAEADDQTRGIRDILFHPRLPVDVRHNAKVRREELAEWAQRRLR